MVIGKKLFYQFLAANFGFKTNALPFEMLAKSLPQNILAKHKNNPMQIEALIFGQAGFLEGDVVDEYPKKLKAEYDFLRKKYSLTPIENHLWKFSEDAASEFPNHKAGTIRSFDCKVEPFVFEDPGYSRGKRFARFIYPKYR